MKVLHVSRTYYPDPPGGIQEAIRQICISTKSFGVENTIFTLSPQPLPSVLYRPEATVVRCRSWAAPASCDLGALQSIQTFRQLVAESDVVHYLFPWPFADVLRECAPRKTSVLTYISDIVRQKWLGAAYEPLMFRTLRSMDAIVFNAPQYAAGSSVLSRSEIQKKLFQIPLGIDESSVVDEVDANIFDKICVDINEAYILFIGVHRYYKGLSYLLEAALQTKGKIVIAGTGPLEESLHVLAEKLNLSNVIFTGEVTDAEKLALLKSCRALILPSHLRSEAYGMVLIEASMNSKPMITCEIATGTSYVNLHGQTGIVVAPASSVQLSGAMNLLLSNADLAAQYGAAARIRYEQQFSGHALGQAYSHLYARLTGQH